MNFFNHKEHKGMHKVTQRSKGLGIFLSALCVKLCEPLW